MSELLHDQLQRATRAATQSLSCATRLHRHMLAILLVQCRATLTNLICVGGTQDQDWSADYRLYSEERFDDDVLFDHVREAVVDSLPDDAPLVVAVDDSIVRKTGKKIHGAGWKRDPLGPPFQTNLVHAQRYLQLSAAWPLADGEAKMIPIDFQHAPTPPKPRKNSPDFEQLQQQYKEASKQANLNVVCQRRLELLREKLPYHRKLILNGDGSFTNKPILNHLPPGCVYLGRGRKDMALHYPVEQGHGSEGSTHSKKPTGKAGKAGKGRPRRYGEKAPTPEALRQDTDIAWQRVEAFAAGTRHQFRVKTMGPVFWRKTGTQLPLRIVVIAPLGYRLSKGGKLLYRQPAYLVCTDPLMTLEDIVQYYLWRWGIEVNFRDEKTLIGTGEAQVRGEASNQHLPAATVAAYAFLWTSVLRAAREDAEQGLACAAIQPPKWRVPTASENGKAQKLPSTGDLQRLLRHETWADSIRSPSNFVDFATEQRQEAKCEKIDMSLIANLFSTA